MTKRQIVEALNDFEDNDIIYFGLKKVDPKSELQTYGVEDISRQEVDDQIEGEVGIIYVQLGTDELFNVQTS